MDTCRSCVSQSVHVSQCISHVIFVEEVHVSQCINHVIFTLRDTTSWHDSLVQYMSWLIHCETWTHSLWDTTCAMWDMTHTLCGMTPSYTPSHDLCTVRHGHILCETRLCTAWHDSLVQYSVMIYTLWDMDTFSVRHDPCTVGRDWFIHCETWTHSLWKKTLALWDVTDLLWDRTISYNVCHNSYTIWHDLYTATRCNTLQHAAIHCNTL